MEVVAVRGEVSELAVEQAPDAAVGFFDVPTVVKAGIKEGEQAWRAPVAGDHGHAQAAMPHRWEHQRP
jgi:hypothetical protein